MAKCVKLRVEAPAPPEKLQALLLEQRDTPLEVRWQIVVFPIPPQRSRRSRRLFRPEVVLANCLQERVPEHLKEGWIAGPREEHAAFSQRLLPFKPSTPLATGEGFPTPVCDGY